MKTIDAPELRTFMVKKNRDWLRFLKIRQGSHTGCHLPKTVGFFSNFSMELDFLYFLHVSKFAF